MSYDVSVGAHDFNMTYNISPVLYDHIPAVTAKGGLSEIDGKTGKEVALILFEAFRRLNATRHEFWCDDTIGEPKFCAKYDAPNGWGSLVGAIIFLGEILGACAENPRAKVKVS